MKRTEAEWIAWGEQVRADVRSAASGLTAQQVERRSDDTHAAIRNGGGEGALRTQLVADEWHRILYIMQDDDMTVYDPRKDNYQIRKGGRR